MTALYVLLIVFAVVMLVLTVPIDCIFDFSYGEKQTNGTIYLKYAFLKLKLYPNTPVERTEEKTEDTDNKGDNKVVGTISFIRESFSMLKKDILSLLDYLAENAIGIKELNVSANIGTGNPMYTGIVYGTANAVVYNAVGVIDRNLKLDKRNISLEADFDKEVLECGVYSKIRTRLMHVIVICFKLLKIFIKIRKSNRRIKEDV